MTAYLLETFGISLGLTLLIEVPLALLFGVRKEGLFVVFLVNVFTNPAVNLIYLLLRSLCGAPAFPTQLLLEIPVVLSEWLIYRAFMKHADMFRRPFLMAFVLNAVSYGTGLLITLFIKMLS